MATSRTAISVSVVAQMASLTGSFRDNPVVDPILRVVLDNTDASKIARASGTLAGSGTTTVDVLGGLTLIDGSTSQSIPSIKMILGRVTNPAANQTFKIGVGASNGLTALVDNASSNLVVGGGINDGIGAFVLLYNPAGYAGVAGTGDIITLTNSGTASLDYELIIIG